jgi:hypothetical protein
MELLNIVSTILWISLSLHCGIIFDKLHRQHRDQQHLVFALNILLLAGLNICIGIYSLINEPIPYSGCALLQKFYFGTSLFQLLLSYCVLERIKKSLQQNQ